MNFQLRATVLSVLFHAMAIASVAALSSVLAAHKETILIDFSVLPPAVQKTVTAEKARPVRPKKKVNKPDKAVKKKEVEKPPPPPAPTAAPVPDIEERVVEQVETPPEEVAALDETTESVPAESDDPVAAAETQTAPSSSSAAAGRPAPAARDFSHIRDKVQRNISYPRIARRMGWEGKVTVSFTICHDGSVQDIKIVESSGNDVLDNNAVDAVKKSTPFPALSLQAKVIIPVVYRLFESN